MERPLDINLATADRAAARIVWHFGFQKTGTTAIQSVCRRNYDVLQAETALFPKFGWTRDLRASAMKWLSGGGETEAVETCVAEICHSIVETGHRTAFVSDENVLGTDIYNATGHIFDFAAQILPIIERAARPHVSQFVFYTREMESWLQSAHAQSVLWTRQTVDYDRWRSDIPFETNWEPHLRRLQACVEGDVIFRDMALDKKEYGLLGGFVMESGGIARDVMASLLPPRGSNERLNAGASQFLLELNRSDINDKPLNLVRREVLRNKHLFTPKPEE